MHQVWIDHDVTIRGTRYLIFCYASPVNRAPAPEYRTMPGTEFPVPGPGPESAIPSLTVGIGPAGLLHPQELKQNARPELSRHVDNMEDYSLVYLGYPNWWGTMSMAVLTFLEMYDFSGKTIIPFCTNEGSGMGHSE